jgi:hypothetical protein
MYCEKSPKYKTKPNNLLGEILSSNNSYNLERQRLEKEQLLQHQLLERTLLERHHRVQRREFEKERSLLRRHQDINQQQLYFFQHNPK